MARGGVQRVQWIVVVMGLLVALGVVGVYEVGKGTWGAGSTSESNFSGQRAYQYALDQCAMGPRPAGSEAGRETGDYIISQLEDLGWDVRTQEFEYEGVTLRNILGTLGEGPIVILGAHYDTRPVADRDRDHFDEPIIGANDGASGVAVLLELGDVLRQYELRNEVWLAFFDAEDRGRVDNWPWSVGSTYMAENLSVRPDYVVVVDMVGDSEQQLYYEGNSDTALRERLWKIAADLGYDEFVPERGHTIIDDHLPFARRGIPAVDIIDVDYPHWHTIEDTCDKISWESLERVGRVVEVLLAGDHRVISSD